MAVKPTSMLPKYLQQEESMSEEFNTFISTLPKHMAWVASHMYGYQGFWYPIRFLQGIISCQNHFHNQESDIFLVTTPKSGTTWLKALMFTVVNRSKYPIDNNHPLFNTNPHDLVPFLEAKLYIDNQIPDLASFPSPRLFSTHSPFVSLPKHVGSKCKIVYLCRNPKDVFVSLWHFTNKLRLEEMGTNSIREAFDLFCNGVSLYGPFWDHVLEYWKQSKENPDRILFFKYEDLKEQPELHLRRLAEFLDCPFLKEEEERGIVDKILKMCSFESLSNLHVNQNGKLSTGEDKNLFFRQGEVGDWKKYLSDEMVETLDQITQEKFGGTQLVL